MAFELKDGQGTLFVNDKQGVESRPDRRGQINIAGTVYELSGWIKKSSKGTVWLSLSAQIPRANAPAETASKAKQIDPDEDVPF
jgi:hypothetical protein